MERTGATHGAAGQRTSRKRRQCSRRPGHGTRGGRRRQRIHDLIVDHLPLIHTVYRQTFRGTPWWCEEDILQEGRLGLCEAAKRFDAGLDIRFSSFAVLRIRGAMIDWLRRQPHPDNRVVRSRAEVVPFSEFDRVEQDSWARVRRCTELPEWVLTGLRAHVGAEMLRKIPTTRDLSVYLDRYVERKTMRSIGHEMGLTESRVSQILRQLRHVSIEPHMRDYLAEVHPAA